VSKKPGYLIIKDYTRILDVSSLYTRHRNGGSNDENEILDWLNENIDPCHAVQTGNRSNYGSNNKLAKNWQTVTSASIRATEEYFSYCLSSQ
jgi:hypothetical protein